jgi:ligand-binding sensor domain-containing protein
MRAFLYFLLILILKAGFAQENLEWEIYSQKQPILQIEFAPNGDVWLNMGDGSMMRQREGVWKRFSNKNSPIKWVGRHFIIRPDGSVWLGNQTGILKFDQEQWTVFTELPWETFSDGLVTDMAFDLQDNLWIATEGALFFYNQVEWKKIEPIQNKITTDYTCLDVDSTGTVWVGTRGDGLHAFNSGNWKNYYLFNSDLKYIGISALKAGTKGEMWVGAPTGDLIRIYQDIWKRWTPDSSLLPLVGINDLTLDYDNNLWISSVYGYTKMDSLGNIENINTSNSTLSNNVIFHVNRNKDGKIWLGAGNQLFIYDQNKYDTIPLHPYVLNDRVILRVVEGKDSLIWVATRNKGLQTFDGSKWNSINRYNSPLISDTLSDIAVDQAGNIWVSFDGMGVQKFDGNTWTLYDFNTAGLHNNDVQRILPGASGKMWFGTPYGLISFNGNNWAFHSPPGISGQFYIFDLALDSVGHVWIGTKYHGLLVFDGMNWIIYDSTNSPLPNLNVVSVMIDKSNVKWIGTHKAGLFTLKDTTFTFYNNTIAGAPVNFILASAQDSSNHYWFSPNQDYLIVKDSSSWKSMNIFNSGAVVGPPGPITVLRNGDIWIATYYEGIMRARWCSSVPFYLDFAPSFSGKLCPGDTLNLYAITDGENLLWNNKYEGNPLPVTQDGIYFATTYNGKNINSCFRNAKDSVSVPFYKMPENLQLCSVEQDTLTGYIHFIWKSPTTSSIRYWEIYQEIPYESQSFELIASLENGSQNQWTDSLNQHPGKPGRYYLLAIDSCGNKNIDRYKPHFIETLFLNHEIKSTTVHHLSWNHPTGMDVLSFYIFRSIAGAPFTCIDTIDSHNSFYRDTVFYAEGEVKYWLKANYSGICQTGIAFTHSNIPISKFTGGNSFSHILSVYPNPSSDLVNIQTSDQILIQSIHLLDIMGRELETLNCKMPVGFVTLDYRRYSPGVYWIGVQTNAGFFYEKLILHTKH